ncbi:NAD(P)-dependent oxidoreductase [Patescibacteria group bacterium]|nr:NAD(P)-dependent oxidoreductase [Patescibacteria group bacterium]
MEKRTHVLVTGASGFLGKTLIPLLEENGYGVQTLGRGEAPFPHLTHYKADASVEIPCAAVEHTDAIVHLASDVAIAKSIQEPAEHIKTNLSMTLNVLEACKQAGRSPLFIYISTDRVYGKATNTVDEESAVFPVEPYVAAKLMSETAVATYAHLLGMSYAIIRTSAVFGPFQPRRGFISDMICKMLEQDSITVGPLQGVKNFTYARNFADSILRLLEAGPTALNRIYNIGGAPYSLSHMLETARNIIERQDGKHITVHIDESIKIPDKHDIGPFRLSTQAAQERLGWKESVSLEEGLEKTIDYFRRTLKNPSSM